MSGNRDPRPASKAFPGARLLVFAKQPVPGRVKTRLIPALGPEGAAALYRALLVDTLERVTAAPLCPVELWCYPDADDAFLRTCGRRFGVRLRTQRGEDLGRRMSGALESTLSEAHSALIVGSDCPGVGPAPLGAALRLLQRGVCEAVFGTVEDGGYAMVGARRPAEALFRDIPWGTAHVMAQTRQRLTAQGWCWAELPVGWDVDRPEDVVRLRATRGGGGLAAAASSAYFRPTLEPQRGPLRHAF